jgi:inositol oxygenase
MIRYHSAYPVHRENAYCHLMNEADLRRMEWVRAFNPFDLYSKGLEPPDVKNLRPFYEDLIAEFFPPQIAW